MDALDTYEAARLPVAASVSGVVAAAPNQRQRFYVELVPEETTIVSWKELVRQANNEVVPADSSEKVVVNEANNKAVRVDSSEKAIVQEPTNEVMSPDSSDEDPVIPFALVKRAKNGPDSATTSQQHP